MAELKAGFYNAVLVDGNPDRTYNAEDVNEYLRGLISDNGIFANLSTACQVLIGNGMNIIVKAGRGKVNNHWFEIESDTVLTLEPADVILNRIDSIVIRHSSTDRNVSLVLKTGTLATNPTAPALSRTSEVFEICLANILVNKNTTTITNTMITDTRPNNEVCGWITGLIEQMDTSTLYYQYQASQEKFINEQTSEFYNWFDNVKEDVKATTLYREYQALYTTSSAKEQTITIPTSINYVHDGLDILNVFINGMKLVKDVEYTINSAGTAITLKTALELADQDIEFVNKKSVSGTAAESIVLQVENLQTEVDKLEVNAYVATGSADNITLSNMVKNFLNGTGDYSGVADNASMKINVVGSLGVDSVIDSQMVFDFHNTNSSNRKVILDFGNATINLPASPTTVQSILAVFGAEDNVTIENANVKIGDYNATTIYVCHGGSIRNSQLLVNNNTATTIYGAWNLKEVSNNDITIYGTNATVNGVYASDNVVLNRISIIGVYNSYPITATDSTLLLGNRVNKALRTTSGTTEIGTIIE